MIEPMKDSESSGVESRVRGACRNGINLAYGSLSKTARGVVSFLITLHTMLIASWALTGQMRTTAKFTRVYTAFTCSVFRLIP